jgi:uncharacterized LabA/DUF88 family protein
VRVSLYVDGFNLYYGRVRGTAFRWLDLGALARALAPGEQIGRIRYFTAIVSGKDDPQKPVRQQVYLRALRTVPELTVHLGHFLTQERQMPLASRSPTARRFATVLRTEEKGSDVNLATYLLVDAFDSDFDEAIVMSNDSDLAEPIRIVRDRFAPVHVFRPNDRHSATLQAAASSYRPLYPSLIRRCQFPSVVTDGKGAIHKPKGW